MKTRYYFESAVAVSLLLTACSQEVELPQPEETTPAQEIRIGATFGSETTRLGMTETDEHLQLHWTETDKLLVLNPQAGNEVTTFTIDEGVGEKGATFTGTPQTAYTQGQKLYAIYNQHDNTVQFTENGDVILDISDQTGVLDERFMYMWGESSYSDGNASFQLKPITSILKVNLELPEGVEELSSIRLYNEDLTTRAAFNMDGTKYGVESGYLIEKDFGSSDRIEITGSFQKTPGTNTVTVYIYAFSSNKIFWWEEENGTMHYYTGTRAFSSHLISASDNQGNTIISSAVFNGKYLQAGKEYELNCPMVTPVKFANEDTAMGTAADPYQISTTDQFYSLMLRAAHNMTNARGNSYNGCSYVLTSDIVLDNRTLWNPINLHDNTFDGQGHTISGNQTILIGYDSAIFGQINNCSLKNLTVDTSLDFADENRNYVGGIVAVAYGSVIENCHNKSNLTVNANQLGGIVAYSDGNTLIGCSNSGTLNYISGRASYEESRIGGLIGYSWNCIMKACYNNATFMENNGAWSCFGGLIGHDEYETQITGCWSYSQLSNTHNNFIYGALLGQANDTVLQNCFYNESSQADPIYTGSCSGSTVDSFSGSTPTAEQIASMNAAIGDTGYQFNEDGTLRKLQGIGAPDMNKKEW